MLGCHRHRCHDRRVERNIQGSLLGMVTAGWRDRTLLLPGPWGQRGSTHHLCHGRPQWLVSVRLITTQWRARAPAAARDRQQQRHAQCEPRSWLRNDKFRLPYRRLIHRRTARGSRLRVGRSHQRYVLSKALGPGAGISLLDGSLDASSDVY